MVNYGWNKDTPNWEESKSVKLAFELSKTLSLPIGDSIRDGKSPYIEVDGAYGGVRIRRITWLSKKEHDQLIEKADKVYNKVMNDLIL